MAKLKIQTGANNPILRKKSIEVKRAEISGKKISKLIKDMRDTLQPNDLGLAAAQVGVNARVALVRLNSGTDQARVIAMINPEITEIGGGVEVAEEGCLSLPEIWVNVARSRELSVKFLNSRGSEQILALKGLNARIIQHEIDHMDGILIVDKAAMEGTTAGLAKSGSL